jgi:uncharacterized membrane protein
MNNRINTSFPTPNNNSSISMSNNNSNFSVPDNNNNGSTPPTGEQSGSSGSAQSSVTDFIMLPLLALTIVLAFTYTILILIRPVFRANKLNWFTINVCLMSTFLSIVMSLMTITRMMNTSSSLPCRAEGFLTAMAASQMMYSHAVIAISRFLTIVYSTKRIFRSTGCIWTFIGLGWIISCLIAVPYLVIDAFTCSNPSQSAFLPYYTLSTVLIVPVMIVLICNIRILLFVHRSTQRVHTESRANNISQARDVRLIKTMIITFIVFVVGWCPLFVEQTFSSIITISSTADAVFQVLPSLSMLCDVILLIYINQPVRLFLWQSIVRRRQIVPVNEIANTVKKNAHIIQNH